MDTASEHLVSTGNDPVVVALLDQQGYCPPVWNDDMQSLVIKETDKWVVSVTPMIFNDRILLSSKEEWPHFWTAGYCYDKGPSAVLAAIIWDPEKERNPLGFKKIAADARGVE